jgi:hypothetical protein
MPDEIKTWEMSEEEMRARVVRLAFGGDEGRLCEFCDAVREWLPPGTAVVLRGSAVTGVRYDDGAPFDADGPGTSDLDLTLVGDEILKDYILDGFYLPAVHTKPLSEKDPDIAPRLVPLREKLCSMVKRPVNIQATRDFFMRLRGDWLGQPYLVLLGKVGEREADEGTTPQGEGTAPQGGDGAARGGDAGAAPERVAEGGFAGAKAEGAT